MLNVEKKTFKWHVRGIKKEGAARNGKGSLDVLEHGIIDWSCAGNASWVIALNLVFKN